MIANILRARWAWFFLSSLVLSDMAPVYLNVHNTFNICHRTVTLPHSSNSMLKYDNTRVLSKKELGTHTSLKRLQTSRVFDADIHEIGLSQDTNSLDSGKDIPILHLYDFLWHRGQRSYKASFQHHKVQYRKDLFITVWSLFQCHCYR